MTGEYKRRAQKIDRDECERPEGEIGPCEARCRTQDGGVIGLCYGHYGETSDSIDDLLDWVAEATAGRGKSTVSPECRRRQRSSRPCTATSER